MAKDHATETMTRESQTALVKQYCVSCHNDRAKAGNLTLATFDAARLDDDTENSEKIIRKLRTGMMPPAGSKRPDAATLTALVYAMESHIAKAAAVDPNPGNRT